MQHDRSAARLAAAVGGVAVLAALTAACGSTHHRPAAAPPPPSTAVTVTTTVPPTTPPTTCPLTGLPAPGGHPPARPALGIKIDNLDAARPQAGLSKADIVYEEPVEGGITRFIAIFQCHDASRVEPVRSGRLIDPQILSQYGPHPLIGYSGAIDAAVSAIDSSSLVDVGADHAAPSEYWRDPSRVAPHNLATSTRALYAAGARAHAPAVAPPPPFPFGPLGPGAVPAASVHIPYQYSDVTWTWNPHAGVWYRSYADTGPAGMAEGGQISASNIVIMHVNMYPSQYVEDRTGVHENLLTLTGSGPLQVLRNGAEISGTWHRASLADPTSYLDSAGRPIAMEPGQTWIELVPNTVVSSVTP